MIVGFKVFLLYQVVEHENRGSKLTFRAGYII